MNMKSCLTNEDPNIFSTSDLHLAISLSFFHNIVGLDNSSPNRIKFLFEYSASLEKTIEDYWNGKLLVDPKGFSNKLSEFKTRIRTGL